MIRFTLALVMGLATSVTALAARAEVAIEEVTSPSGITAWLVEDHTIPFTALEIRFRGGTSLDAPDSRGAIYLMTGLLEEGAGEMDAREFARAREALAASYQFDSNDDDVSISARFLSENRPEAVELLRAAITAPRFDEDAVERVRGQVLSGLASDAKDPDDIAGKGWSAQIYGDHPYGTPGQGHAGERRGAQPR